LVPEKEIPCLRDTWVETLSLPVRFALTGSSDPAWTSSARIPVMARTPDGGYAVRTRAAFRAGQAEVRATSLKVPVRSPHPVPTYRLLGDTWRVDPTDHLKASLEATIALANATGPEWTQGRARAEFDAAAVEAVLRLTSNRPVPIDLGMVEEFAAGGQRIYRALRLLAEGETDAAATALNALLASTRAAPVLVRHRESAWHLHFATEGVSVATGWLADFGTAAAMLLGSDELDRLRQCAAERCDNVFLDATRNHLQRFCSTACQNRTKVAAFRSRDTQA
jgi:hypothetical protein